MEPQFCPEQLQSCKFASTVVFGFQRVCPPGSASAAGLLDREGACVCVERETRTQIRGIRLQCCLLQRMKPLLQHSDTTTATAQATSQSRDRLHDENCHDDNESTLLIPKSRAAQARANSLAHCAEQKRCGECLFCIGRIRKASFSVCCLAVTIAISAIALVAAWYTTATNNVSHFPGNKRFSSRLPTNRRPLQPHCINENVPPLRYDYIVVGAGPAGIIAAVSLARALPQQTIVLLEAGTTSQASVLSNIQATMAQRRRRRQQCRPRNHAPPCCDGDASDGRSNPRSSPWSTTSLNEFDVPLLWSGVAASSGGAMSSSSTESLPSNARNPRPSPRQRAAQTNATATLDDRFRNPDHHWPIGRTLLGKNIGGSGIHNAMIYIRSLAVGL
jgi:hypothetical protein